MRTKIFSLVLLLVMAAAGSAFSGVFDEVLNQAGSLAAPQEKSSDATVVSGLKEALSIGSKNAVGTVSQPNGYFSNQMIKILMPKKIQMAADMLAKVGFQKEVDDFVLSMNRAAEKAAPKAASYFVDAVKGMSFDDAAKILKGGDTAATDYFRKATSASLYDAFKPIISASMAEVGATSKYQQMMKRYETIPLAQKQSLDLDHYVTNSALDGLFYMVGQEEKKIRTNPAARVTDLLKSVFGK